MYVIRGTHRENDPNVPVVESIDVLRANSISARIEVYPDGGHAISSQETGTVQAEFLDDLVEFIEWIVDPPRPFQDLADPGLRD